MKDLIKQTRDLNKLFEERSRKMSKQDRMLDLVEEVGELAQAMLIVNKRKFTRDPAKQKTKNDVTDALCDVLFDLILLAEDYGIELDAEYMKMLEEMQKRVEGGEFDRGQA